MDRLGSRASAKPAQRASPREASAESSSNGAGSGHATYAASHGVQVSNQSVMMPASRQRGASTSDQAASVSMPAAAQASQQSQHAQHAKQAQQPPQHTQQAQHAQHAKQAQQPPQHTQQPPQQAQQQPGPVASSHTLGSSSQQPANSTNHGYTGALTQQQAEPAIPSGSQAQAEASDLGSHRSAQSGTGAASQAASPGPAVPPSPAAPQIPVLQQTPPHQQADAATAGTGFPVHSTQPSAVPGRNGDLSASSIQDASPPDHSTDAGLEPGGSTPQHSEGAAQSFNAAASSNGIYNLPSEGSTPLVPSDRAAHGTGQLASNSNSSQAHETSASVGPAATSHGSHSNQAALASGTPSTESGSEAAHVHDQLSVAIGSHSSQATAAAEPLSNQTPAQAAGSQPQSGIPGAHRSAVTDDSDGAQTEDRNVGPGWLQHEEVYLPCDEEMSPMNYVVYSEESDEEEDQDGLLCKLVFEVCCLFVATTSVVACGTISTHNHSNLPLLLQFCFSFLFCCMWCLG